MAHEIETMAFAGQLPWHGLGRRVDPSVSIEEMLVAAGLDWSVNKHRLICEGLVDDAGNPVASDQIALVRSTDKAILTTAGENWEPLQNRDAMEFFRDYCAAGGVSLETAGSLRGGRIVWGLAALGKGYEVSKGDAVNGYLLLISPHEYGKSIQAKVTSVRVVCANTMAVAISDKGHGLTYRQTHRVAFDAAAAKATVASAVVQFMTGQDVAKRLLKTKINLKDAMSVLVPHFQPGAVVAEIANDFNGKANRRLREVVQAVQTAPGATPGTAWGVLNGVTYWADHVAARNADNRLSNAWLGTSGKIKIAVQEDLLQLAA